MTRKLFFVVSLMLAGYQIFAQSNAAAPTDSDAQKRHAEYFQLNRQIYARHEDPGSGYSDVLRFLRQRIGSVEKKTTAPTVKDFEGALIL